MSRIFVVFVGAVIVSGPVVAQSRRTIPSRQAHRTAYRRPSFQRAHGPTNRSTQPRPAARSTGSRSFRNRGVYRLDAGDVLAIIVDGVLGDYASAPVHLPKGDSDLLPGIGHPLPVLDDGTVSLPLIPPVSVRGLSVTEAQRRISRIYVAKRILRNEYAVTVNLLRKRTVRVTVVQTNPAPDENGLSVVNLPADSANLLSALAQSGSFDHPQPHRRCSKPTWHIAWTAG